MKRPPPSLQARALAWLAQREHSRSELRSKLLRAAQRQAAAQPEAAPSAEELLEQVERLLGTLQARGLLSDERFVESRVRLRAASQGARRIQMELARHGLKASAATLQELRDSELQRALLVWQRRFGRAAADDKARARQARFLAGRGFGGEVIHKVLAATAARPEAAADGEPG